MQGKDTINDFLKAIQKEFGEVEYKITTIDGVTFRKTKGWRDAKIQFDETEFAKFNNQVKRTRF
ncbi:hypothetical protein UFOVP89_19 [uncultured Caudovirales phage]|uniref:Uncharacterized protein n=1 Tax=uncultured Caudovirales phage TaxID=2100421 RepID=A0A6J5KZA3_9CAUD|nr:hypothetical protein UFOVP89_19 [uncultured Caudovirales phage]